MSSNAVTRYRKRCFGNGTTSDARRNKEIDTRIGAANAILREVRRSVVNKTGAFKHRKAAVF